MSYDMTNKEGSRMGYTIGINFLRQKVRFIFLRITGKTVVVQDNKQSEALLREHESNKSKMYSDLRFMRF